MARPSGPRIRSLKPELWQDERLDGLDDLEHRLYVGLVTQADDEGRHSANLSLIRSRVFPFDPRPVDALQAPLQALAEHDLIELYEVAGLTVLRIVTWGDDQRIDRPTPSKLPPPPREPSPNDPDRDTNARDESSDTRDEPPNNPETAEESQSEVPRDQSRGLEDSSSSRARPRTGPDLDLDRTRSSGYAAARARQEITSRSLADTVACPRCGVAPGEKCDGVRGKRESAHLERHHAVGELLNLPRPVPHQSHRQRGAAVVKPYKPDTAAADLRESHFPDADVVAIDNCMTALRFRRQPITPEAIRELLYGTQEVTG